MTSPLPGARASRLRGARALFTARSGGVSEGPWSSLNLARHVGDEPARVEANRARLETALARRVVYVEQVHSADVVTVDAETGVDDLAARPRRADALVTARSDVALAIMVADCLPVLLVDAEAGVVGAAHAGRRGLLDGILPATVEAMEGLGARAEAIAAEIGPSVCGRCYEVPAAMRDESEALIGGIGAETSWGTPSLDLRAGAVSSLVSAGLDAANVLADAPCTVEDEAFFSYRCAATTGRFAGAIALP